MLKGVQIGANEDVLVFRNVTSVHDLLMDVLTRHPGVSLKAIGIRAGRANSRSVGDGYTHNEGDAVLMERIVTQDDPSSS